MRLAAFCCQVFEEYPLGELLPFIDWNPFFQARLAYSSCPPVLPHGKRALRCVWQLRGKYPNRGYPKIFKDEAVGGEAKKLHDDALKLINEIVEKKMLTAKGVVGIWPANSVGDDIEVYSADGSGAVLGTFHTLRQQEEREDTTYYAMSDFIAPKSSGKKDYIGAFAVSTGFGCEEICAKLRKENDDYRGIMMEAVADRLAEARARPPPPLHSSLYDRFSACVQSTAASSRRSLGAVCACDGQPACTRVGNDHRLPASSIPMRYVATRMIRAVDASLSAFAELLHYKMRTELWGYAPDEKVDIDDMLKVKYTGIRPAPGYPTQPDHTEKNLMWKLLGAESAAGIKLTDSLAMLPAASVSALVFANPCSTYFQVGKICKDQVVEYAGRKNMSVEEVEKWMGPYLGYDDKA
eukprot:126515-Pleurochrysis_carterae.AAC.2